MQLLSAKFAQVDASILDIQTQITALQAKLTALQDYRQQLQSVEQACESALSQVDTALMMLHHVDPSQVDTFKNALDLRFSSEVIGILEPAAPANPAPEPPAPDAPPEHNNDAVIEVQVTPTETPAVQTEPETAPDMDIEQALANMSLPSLRMLAKSKKVDARGTAANIARRLKTLVTESDLRAAS